MVDSVEGGDTAILTPDTEGMVDMGADTRIRTLDTATGADMEGGGEERKISVQGAGKWLEVEHQGDADVEGEEGRIRLKVEEMFHVPVSLFTLRFVYVVHL